MDGIESKSTGFFLPGFTDELVGSETAEGLEPFGEIVGSDEVAEVISQLVMAVVVVALNRSFLKGAVHALHLAIGPGMIRFSEPVLDTMAAAHSIEGMTAKASGWSFSVPGKIGELDAVVGEHGVDAIRDSCHQCFQEGHGGSHVSALD